MKTITFTEIVEVWNSKHEGNVSVSVEITTDTPADQWSNRDWEALGEFVSQNYEEGDESRDVRYRFNRFNDDTMDHTEPSEAELIEAQEAAEAVAIELAIRQFNRNAHLTETTVNVEGDLYTVIVTDRDYETGEVTEAEIKR